MKCERVADWYDEHDDQEGATAWEDILHHARTCPDCSLFLRQRQDMMELLSRLPEPEPPPQLHAGILQAVETFGDPSEAAPGEGSQETFLDRLLVGWARPLQGGLSLACAIMVFQLFTLQDARHQASEKPPAGKVAFLAKAPRVPSPTDLPRSGQLPQLKPEEVKAFLDKLDAYRRAHPEMEPSSPSRSDVRLVGHAPLRGW